MGDSDYFRGVLVATDIWKEMGWSAIIYLAALSGVPSELYEAATVDGASKFQKMRFVTFPCILPTIIIMLLLRVGNILNSNFEQVFTMYNSRSHLIGHTGNYGSNTCLHSFKYLTDNIAVPK